MHVEVSGAERLRFGDGSPVRAASAVVRFGDGRLVVSDDATHAAWFRPGGEPTRVRLLPPVEGHEVFDEESGTKHLKPDLEAACRVEVDGEAPAVLRDGLGVLAEADDVVPGSARWTARRTSSSADGRGVRRVPAALDVDLDALNLEGACVVGRSLRWFHRGLPSAGLPSGSVDLDLDAAVVRRTRRGRRSRRCRSPAAPLRPRVRGRGRSGDHRRRRAPGRRPARVRGGRGQPQPPRRRAGDGHGTRSSARRPGRRRSSACLISTADAQGRGAHGAGRRRDGATLYAVTDVDDPDAASWAATLHVRL